MSYHVFFSFSSGLSKTMVVPKGTTANCIAHVEGVEKELNIPRETYKGVVRWDTTFKWDIDALDDEVLCETAQEHNEWIRRLYDSFCEWANKPVKGGERLTPKKAQTFWFGLHEIHVPASKWTADYYRDRMEHLYKVMRGREHEGAQLDKEMEETPLTARQAAAVIRLFSEYLDPDDRRLDVPWDCDFLASSYDGGYEWCDKCCRPILPEHIYQCECKDCPLKDEDEGD